MLHMVALLPSEIWWKTKITGAVPVTQLDPTTLFRDHKDKLDEKAKAGQGGSQLQYFFIFSGKDEVETDDKTTCFWTRDL